MRRAVLCMRGEGGGREGGPKKPLRAPKERTTVPRWRRARVMRGCSYRSRHRSLHFFARPAHVVAVYHGPESYASITYADVKNDLTRSMVRMDAKTSVTPSASLRVRRLNDHDQYHN